MGKRILLTLVFGITFNAFAGYDYNYDWESQYSSGNFTQQVWSFDNNSNQPNSPFLPNVISENPGYPTLSIDYNIGLGSGWSANRNGKIGVYFDPAGLGFTLNIPNYDVQNPLKVVVLKVGYRDAEFGNAVVTSAGSVEMISSSVDMFADGWNVLTAVWEIRPNPANETIQFNLSPVGTSAVDWVAVHTVCVPEPATLSLLALGGLFAVKRKK